MPTRIQQKSHLQLKYMQPRIPPPPFKKKNACRLEFKEKTICSRKASYLELKKKTICSPKACQLEFKEKAICSQKAWRLKKIIPTAQPVLLALLAQLAKKAQQG